jgi:hypothetical protein
MLEAVVSAQTGLHLRLDVQLPLPLIELHPNARKTILLNCG